MENRIWIRKWYWFSENYCSLLVLAGYFTLEQNSASYLRTTSYSSKFRIYVYRFSLPITSFYRRLIGQVITLKRGRNQQNTYYYYYCYYRTQQVRGGGGEEVVTGIWGRSAQSLKISYFFGKNNLILGLF